MKKRICNHEFFFLKMALRRTHHKTGQGHRQHVDSDNEEIANVTRRLD